MTQSFRLLTAPALALALTAVAIAPASAQSAKTSSGGGSTTSGSVAAPASSGDMLFKLSPQDVAPILDDNNIGYEITIDDVGDPLILVESDQTPAGERMAVFYYDCDSSGCEDLTLYAYYSARTPATLEAVNDYNEGLRWGRAFLDGDNDPVFELDINATGGIGRDALRILVQTYLNGMVDFAGAMNAP